MTLAAGTYRGRFGGRLYQVGMNGLGSGNSYAFPNSSLFQSSRVGVGAHPFDPYASTRLNLRAQAALAVVANPYGMHGVYQGAGPLPPMYQPSRIALAGRTSLQSMIARSNDEVVQLALPGTAVYTASQLKPKGLGRLGALGLGGLCGAIFASLL